MRTGKSLKHLLNINLSPEDLAWDHAMDISASVYERMNQLGLQKQELAERMDVSPAQVTKILTGKQNMTLKTIAKLESALAFDLSSGFKRPKKDIDTDYELLVQDIKRGTGAKEERAKLNASKNYSVGITS